MRTALRAAAFSFIVFLAPAVALAQTVSTGYCITGTSSAVNYAWWIDLSCNGLNQSTEPSEPAAGPVFPNGASSSALATDFAASITANATSMARGISATASGACFTVNQSPGVCVGGSNPGASCTTSAQCPGGGVCQSQRVCIGGSNPGASCTTSAQCPGGGVCGAQPFCLMVGTTSPTCQVTSSGCSYNPVIRLATSNIPALGPVAIVCAVALIVGAFLLAMRKRSRFATESP